MASSGVAFFGKPSFYLPTINNTDVCFERLQVQVYSRESSFSKAMFTLHLMDSFSCHHDKLSGESLLTSVFTFFLISIRLNS